jgi:hypothetical protein
MSNKPVKKQGAKFNFAAFDMFGSPVAFNIKGDETYKTVIGCFWTLVMLLSLAGAFLWYFLIFINKTDIEISSRIETQDTYPKLDFVETGFFFSVYATKDKKITKLGDLQDTFIIEATYHRETKTDSSSTPTIETPIGIPFEPCVNATNSAAQAAAS